MLFIESESRSDLGTAMSAARLNGCESMNEDERTASQKICLEPGGGIERLLEIMRRLRDPVSGCPWDVEQDFDSISTYTIEEAYEVEDAIRRKAWNELASELGDLLLQVVYHSEIASEKGLFDFKDVVEAISDKMVRRHPHVFGTDQRRSADEQKKHWEDAKFKEREEDKAAGILSGIPAAIPALIRASKLQGRAARVGFDWPDVAGVLEKLEEELTELDEARRSLDSDRIAEEFGDVLFTAVNLSRHLGIDAEDALRRANKKFSDRFEQMEELLNARFQEQAFRKATLQDMEDAWNATKG